LIEVSVWCYERLAQIDGIWLYSGFMQKSYGFLTF
jgi:hypothetical protein